MAKLKVYEIRIQRDGAWKIDSVFDEGDLAVDEAKRLEQTRLFTAVLVVEETYDEETERTNTRTIYRAGKEQADAKAAPSKEQPEESNQRRPTPKEQAGQLRRRPGPRSPPKKSSRGNSWKGRCYWLSSLLVVLDWFIS